MPEGLQEYIQYRSWAGGHFSARRSPTDPKKWDIIIGNELQFGFPSIEYKTTDASDWYCGWSDNPRKPFHHVRSNGVEPHDDHIINYLGPEPYSVYQAEWDAKQKKFRVKRLS